MWDTSQQNCAMYLFDYYYNPVVLTTLIPQSSSTKSGNYLFFTNKISYVIRIDKELSKFYIAWCADDNVNVLF